MDINSEWSREHIHVNKIVYVLKFWVDPENRVSLLDYFENINQQHLIGSHLLAFYCLSKIFTCDRTMMPSILRKTNIGKALNLIVFPKIPLIYPEQILMK